MLRSEMTVPWEALSETSGETSADTVTLSEIAPTSRVTLRLAVWATASSMLFEVQRLKSCAATVNS